METDFYCCSYNSQLKRRQIYVHTIGFLLTMRFFPDREREREKGSKMEFEPRPILLLPHYNENTNVMYVQQEIVSMFVQITIYN
jgi:hypothetical protein